MCPIRAHAHVSKDATYDGVVDFGAQVIHLKDGCLSVDGTVRSGNFFEDLKRLDIGMRPEYRKGRRVVTEYPATLITSIRMLGDQCPDALSNSPSAVFGGGAYSLTFQVEWKDGMQLRPAALCPVVAQCAVSRIATNPGSDFTFPAITCQMMVDSKGVPLVDHLIVSVFAADGKRLTRLSAAP